MQNSQITVLLNDNSLNRENSKMFMNYVGKVSSIPGFILPEPYRLVSSVICNEFRIISSDPDPETLFLIRLFDLPSDHILNLSNYSSLNKKLTQCLVWSSLVPGQPDAFQFLATKFFDYFLNQYNIGITPGPMTLASAHFWEGRLTSAFMNPKMNVIKSDGQEIFVIPNWDAFQEDWSEMILKSSENIQDQTVIVISKENEVKT
ncbi:hypothetical protein C1Y41_04690 [Pantoea sp. ICBG 1758]|uniref:hypothetical protein n=1 Tax=Pantoea sp. ICBG 1758 TaxID=2071682 RepID=UPI000CE30A04|nr:hypothetical protein [Pantoea sp. ICBG 1758]PPC63944.1 hypothetical protein C1Y41_04690 [Pantoea sp. ICBG 1758]